MRSVRALTGVLMVSLVACAPAFAAFPGDNGKLAQAGVDVYAVNPDDTGLAQLTNDAAYDRDVAWSPDGQRIAFATPRDGGAAEIYVMDANGSNPVRLTNDPAADYGPTWSPDGTKIAFESDRDGDSEIWVMDADGSNAVNLSQNPLADFTPAWSPDGTRIAFAHTEPEVVRGGGPTDIHVMDADGSNETLLTNQDDCHVFVCKLYAPDWSPDGTRIAYVWDQFDWSEGDDYQELRSLHLSTGQTAVIAYGGQADFYPYFGGPFYGHSWSPDGHRIAWARGSEVEVANADGSNPTTLQSPAGDGGVAWQPLPIETAGSHLRPKSATPFRVPLVPAAKPCTSPNRTHGPPLAFGSCNPVQPGSSYLTVGVGDGSPSLARSTGSVRLDVQLGAPGAPEDSDVNIRFSLTNVMRASDLSEYSGELRPEMTVRRTDRDGLGFAPHSTSMDFPFGFTVPCNPTPASSLDASSCISFTSVNAVVPLAIEDTQRAVWALDALRVYDGGPDEDADTDADNSLFMTQGLFVP